MLGRQHVGQRYGTRAENADKELKPEKELEMLAMHGFAFVL
jgi:hypothetical protein